MTTDVVVQATAHGTLISIRGTEVRIASSVATRLSPLSTPPSFAEKAIMSDVVIKTTPHGTLISIHAHGSWYPLHVPPISPDDNAHMENVLFHTLSKQDQDHLCESVTAQLSQFLNPLGHQRSMFLTSIYTDCLKLAIHRAFDANHHAHTTPSTA